MPPTTEPATIARLGVGAVVVLSVPDLDLLVTHLGVLGYEVKGPTPGDDAIVPGSISSSADLPRGIHDVQSPGSYALVRGDDDELFGWAVGPESWKQEYFPSSQVMWLSLIHISEPTRQAEISYAVFCL